MLMAGHMVWLGGSNALMSCRVCRVADGCQWWGEKLVPLRAHSASSGWISGNTGAMSTTTALPLILRGVWGADSAAGAVSVLHWVADVRVRVQLAISGGE